MIIQSINGISYRLRTAHDLSWLSNYGRVFSVIDETGSGCICFGVENPDGRFFFKIAGADTIEGEVSPAESVTSLKNAVQIYRDLAHPSLISLRDSFRHGELYAAVFDWADGEGLFDHWNFDKYSAENITPPYQRFKKLPIDKRLNAVSDIISFLENTAAKGYVACDFYDGSLIYDFDRDKLTICDIDFFRKAPVVNSVGEDYWGTKRLKAPEEYIKGAVIDEATNVFTLGAIIFDIFGAVVAVGLDVLFYSDSIAVSRSDLALEVDRKLNIRHYRSSNHLGGSSECGLGRHGSSCAYRCRLFRFYFKAEFRASADRAVCIEPRQRVA